MQKYQMFREIEEQPEILSALWKRRESIKQLVQSFSKTSWIIFTAFGSSYNAALYGQVLFYRFLGIPSMVATPGFFLRSQKKPDLKNGLVVAISQSGKVREVIEASRILKRSGVRSLALTNDANSPLAHASDDRFVLGAGIERSVPATKTFTATLFSLQLIAAFWGAREMLKNLARTAELARQTIDQRGEMRRLARKLSGDSRGFIISPEALKPIACEGALKLNECANFMAEPFDWREFFHGPIALAERKTPAVFLADPGDPKASANFLGTLKKRGARAYSIPSLKNRKDASVAAIPYAIQLQMLALELARLKGRNPDHPRALHKVTQTPLR